MGGSFVQGPIPLAALLASRPPYAPLIGQPSSPAQAQVDAQTPPSPPAAEPKKDEKKDDKKEDKKEPNAYAPTELPEGVSYMFDNEHTMLHIFNKAAPIWTEKYRTQKL